jgi:hypothetical protein
VALLGDNPMQSEFACHIGLMGKFFCRMCWVKGFDNQGISEEDHIIDHQENSQDLDTNDVYTTSSISQRRKRSETMIEMVNSVKCFLYMSIFKIIKE